MNAMSLLPSLPLDVDLTLNDSIPKTETFSKTTHRANSLIRCHVSLECHLMRFYNILSFTLELYAEPEMLHATNAGKKDVLTIDYLDF